MLKWTKTLKRFYCFVRSTEPKIWKNRGMLTFKVMFFFDRGEFVLLQFFWYNTSSVNFSYIHLNNKLFKIEFSIKMLASKVNFFYKNTFKNFAHNNFPSGLSYGQCSKAKNTKFFSFKWKLINVFAIFKREVRFFKFGTFFQIFSYNFFLCVNKYMYIDTSFFAKIYRFLL